MRILFCIILLAILFPRGSPAGELVPDVLAFDPPAFLSADAFVGNNTNSENETRKIWRYAATDNDPRTSQRLLIVSLREIGVATNLENAVTYRRLDDQAFRAEMLAAMNSTRSATNVSPVTEVEVGGTAALLATYELPQPYWQKPDGVFCPCEVYWVRIETNRVAEIKLVADSAAHLQTLKACLPKFTITPAISKD